MSKVSTPLQLQRAVTRLIKAELEYSWKGASDPEHWDSIEKELKDARKNYKKHCVGIAHLIYALRNREL